MGGDSRIGKCCCSGECEWPVISTTSANLLSHVPNNGINERDLYYLQVYGGIVSLATPSGTLPSGDIAFYNDVSNGITMIPANHWHATLKTDINDVAAGDRAGWMGFINSPQTNQFQLYRHQLLQEEVTCQELHTLWDAFILTSTYTDHPENYDVGIPVDSRLFWVNNYSENAVIKNVSQGRFVLIFFDSTWGSDAYKKYYLADTFTTTQETYYSETDSIDSVVLGSKAFCSWRCSPANYFSLIKAIQ